LYLKEKHIIPLVKYLIDALLLHEPDDQVAFVIHQVKELINFRDNLGKPLILFNDSCLTNVFKSVDFLKSGSVDLKQYLASELN